MVYLPENISGGKKRIQPSNPAVPGFPLFIVSYISYNMKIYASKISSFNQTFKQNDNLHSTKMKKYIRYNHKNSYSNYILILPVDLPLDDCRASSGQLYTPEFLFVSRLQQLLVSPNNRCPKWKIHVCSDVPLQTIICAYMKIIEF